MKTRTRTILTPLLAVLFGLFAHASAQTVSQGTWKKQAYTISGGWEIVKEGDGHVLKLDENFKTRSGPDLKIFLTPHSLESVSGNNATEGSKLVAALKKNKGAATYKIPAGTDLTKYKTMVIHCEKFSKLWGAAKL